MATAPVSAMARLLLSVLATVGGVDAAGVMVEVSPGLRVSASVGSGSSFRLSVDFGPSSPLSRLVSVRRAFLRFSCHLDRFVLNISENHMFSR